MERIKQEVDDICHIYNRGTDKRIIFDDDEDRFRFIHYLYACNDRRSLDKLWDSPNGNPPQDSYREPLVDLYAYVQMPNHFHIVVRQRVKDGISKFMQKLSVAYTMYFNKKNVRSGVLFQGKYKYKIVDDERYLAALVHYIHVNPLDIFQPGWKDGGLRDRSNAHKFLISYRWSSYLDYRGNTNFPSLLNLTSIGDFTDKEDVFRDFVMELTADSFEDINHLMLD